MKSPQPQQKHTLVVLITVLLVLLLVDCCPSSAATAAAAIQFHGAHNCSHYCPSQYDVAKFEGEWRYIELFSQPPLHHLNLNCLTLSAQVRADDTLYMNLTLPMPPPDDGGDADGYGYANGTAPEPAPNQRLLIAQLYGWVDSSVRVFDPDNNKYFEAGRLGTWRTSSKLSLVASKWIILSAVNEVNLLYVTCGEFPDGTSAIGEIGVLSRNNYISGEAREEFEAVLARYGLGATRTRITHNRCRPPSTSGRP